MAYPTVEQLVAVSEVEPLQQASPEQQDAWFMLAKRAVESFCGQSFEAEDATRVLPGTGDRRLPLDRRLAAITGLSIVGFELESSLDLSDVALTDSHDALYVTPDAASGGTWATKVLREGRPPVFPAGEGTVSITGTWGWLASEMADNETSPVAIAMRLDMEDAALARKHGLADTVRAQSKLGLVNVNEGGVNATLSSSSLLLSADAQTLLADYVWQPVGVGA